MAPRNHEIPLSGGRTTTGVVRIGNTVRRPPTLASDFVQRLLHHLTVVGFGGAPRALGIDNQGRDILEYLEGDVPSKLAFHDDATLIAAASLIRRYHDLSAALIDSPAARHVGFEVVCHNDLSPCNFVFRSGRPVALIDFDAATLGTRVHDLGYAAWLWLELGCRELEVMEQRRRLALFVSAYAFATLSVSALLDAVLTRQRILTVRGEQLSDEAMARWAESCRDWTERHRAVLHGDT